MGSVSPAVMPISAQPVKVFVSYSRKDETYLENLRKQLRVFERTNQIDLWFDTKTRPGADCEREIHSQFMSAQIIILLVSADFIDSEYCWKLELPAALRLRDERGVHIIPIIIRPVEWKQTVLGEIKALPQNGRAIELWEHQESAYSDIAQELGKLIAELRQAPPTLDGRKIWDQTEVPPSTVATPSQPAVPGRFPVPKVFTCFLNQAKTNKLLKLRQWCHSPKDSKFQGRAAELKECRTLREAVEGALIDSANSILLLDGFEPHAPQLDELLHIHESVPILETIVNAPEWEEFASHCPTASILYRTRRTVTNDDNLLETLRKSVLRIRTQQIIGARVLKSKSELEEYFSLRFRVWHELGYLPREKACLATRWELDFTDRTSLPFGLFSKSTGKILAVARLVRGFGNEDLTLVHTINEMLREKNSQPLARQFDIPAGHQQPYDILKEMSLFQEYYRGLVKRGIRSAEVSRVIVDPDWQNCGLGEVLVDTLCSLARAHAVSTVFLACHTRHSPFYRRCGFELIPGVSGTKFSTYDVPCVAMERGLVRSC